MHYKLIKPLQPTGKTQVCNEEQSKAVQKALFEMGYVTPTNKPDYKYNYIAWSPRLIELIIFQDYYSEFNDPEHKFDDYFAEVETPSFLKPAPTYNTELEQLAEKIFISLSPNLFEDAATDAFNAAQAFINERNKRRE